MSKSHKNDRNFFPKFNLYQLQQYAEIWAEKFSILQIEKITLYRVSSLVFEGAIKKYALVFEYSGVQDPDAIDYGCQEFGLQPLESYPIDSENPFITALKEIKHADQFASQGRHRLFDSFFVNTVYREKPSGDGDYFREWTYILRPSGSKDPLPRGVLAGRLYWILYPDSGASDALQSTEITKTEPDLDVFKEKKIFPCKPGTKWDDVKITLTGDDTVRIKTPQGEGVFSYHQLELADRRIPKGKATILWTLLESFAKNNGFI